MRSQGNQKKVKHPRITKKRCPYCGHDKMWGQRSETGQGSYRFKCSRCGYQIK